MGKEWKWWYFVVAGILVIALGGYQIYELRIGKGIGSLILGVLATFVGIISRGEDDVPDDDEAEDPDE